MSLRAVGEAISQGAVPPFIVIANVSFYCHCERSEAISSGAVPHSQQIASSEALPPPRNDNKGDCRVGRTALLAMTEEKKALLSMTQPQKNTS